MMESSTELLLWILAALVALILTKLWWGSRGVPPGPMGIPLFGFLPYIKDNAHEQFAELANIYGEIFSFRTFGGRLITVVNGPKAAKEMFHDRAEEFYGRPALTNALNFFDGGRGIAQTEGPDWKEKRRFFVSAAKNFGFGKTEFEWYIHELIWKMLDDIRSTCKTKRGLFDAREEVTFVTGNVILKIICNKKFRKDDPEFRDLVQGFLGIFSGGLKSFFLVGIWFKLMMKLTAQGRFSMKSINKLHHIVKGIVDEHVETFDPSNQRDFIDAYLGHMKTLAEKGQLENSFFSLDNLKSITLNMLLEGTESTGSTIASLVYKLSEYPDAQRKAQEEIDEVVGQSRLPSWTDRPKLPYVDALILELYRVAIFFNISTLYSNFEETQIRGYRIPKRSLLMMNFWSINNDPKLFTNPEKFHPERFLGPDGRRTKQDGPVPFGVGKRSCVGESLAQIEVFLIISSILQNFTLSPENEVFQVRAEPRNKDLPT